MKLLKLSCAGELQGNLFKYMFSVTLPKVEQFYIYIKSSVDESGNMGYQVSSVQVNKNMV
jgi:hypothetical protein